MKHLHLWYLVILTVFFPSRSYTQSDVKEGYIITSPGDTLYGDIAYRSPAASLTECRFVRNDELTIYSPDDLLGYGISDQRVYSSTVLNGTFVEVLVEGPLSLFRGPDYFLLRKQNKDELYPLEASTSEVDVEGKTIIRTDNTWRGLVAFLISDCIPAREAGALTRSLNLSQKELTRVVVRYNECLNAPYTVYNANTPWTKVRMGAGLSGVWSTLTTTSDDQAFLHMSDQYQSLDPAIGLVMAISFPRTLENLTLQTEAYYRQARYAGLREIDYPARTDFHDTYLDFAVLSVPVSLKYRFAVPVKGLFVQAGMQYDYLLQADTRLLTETVVGERTVNTAPESLAFRPTSGRFGFWGGIGWGRPLGNWQLEGSLRYGQIPGLAQNPELQAADQFISFHFIILKQ